MSKENTKSIARNGFWLAISEVINGLLMFVVTIFLARYLGAESYGKLMFALSFVTLFIIPIDLGLSTLVTRELSGEREKTKKYLDNLILFRVITGIAAFLLILIIVQFLGKENEVRYIIYLLGLWTVFQTSTQFFQAIFRAHEKMFYEAVTRISHALILTILSLCFVWYKFELLYFGWAYCFAALITLIIAVIFVWKNFSHFSIKIDIKFLKETFIKSWPFALSLLFVSIYYYMDSVMLGILKDEKEVGLYSAAFKLIVFITIMGSVMSRSVYPIISKLFKSSIKELKIFLENYSKFIFIIAIPIAFGGIILSSKIIRFVYGDNFDESVLAFQILVIFAATIYISTIYAHSLQICNKQKTHLLGMGLGALINVALNLFLIPYYGLIGAAISTVATEIFILIFMYINFSKIIKLKVLKYFYKPLLASLIMFLALNYLMNINLFLLLIIGVTIYFISMFLIRGVSREDLKLISGLFIKS